MDFDAIAERMIIGLVPLTTEMTLKPLIASALRDAYNAGAESVADELMRWWPEDRVQISEIAKKVSG